MIWYNEPSNWSTDKNGLYIHAEGDTDFWRITHYDFIHDDGHFYYQERAGDWVATVKISGEYTSQYDQAGLMVRLNEQTWIKAGIEYIDDRQHLSAVVTREHSDWSVAPTDLNPESVYLRLTRQGDAVRIDYSFDDFTYLMLRLAYFPPDVPVQIGPMAAAPTGSGFSVTFEQLTVLSLV